MPDSSAFKLTIRQGPKPNQTFDLDKDVLSLGREAGNDLVIEDPQISRRHARLTRQGNSYLLEDLGSTNGTFVNGSRVSTPVLLANGDLIGLADTIVLAVQIPVVIDSGETFVGHATDADSTSVKQGPAPTQPAFTPPVVPPVAKPVAKPQPQPVPAYVPPAAYPPVVAPIQETSATDNRRMILIGCGCLALLAIVALIGLVAWSFIDCASFSGVFKFLFPPFAC
ncbi:MAG TPA: FHA domain-containing protein [Anaerolineae bacterium]|nr:FHA domain-containing protein [Anaerolineae bacterium]